MYKNLNSKILSLSTNPTWNYDSTMPTANSETDQGTLDGDPTATATQETQDPSTAEKTTETHQTPPDEGYEIVQRGTREHRVRKAFNMNSGGPQASTKSPTTTSMATLVEYTGTAPPPPAELITGREQL